MKQKLHPIGYVARITGLSPHLIRAWERRYGVVKPDRSNSNRRLYSDEDIHRLRTLQKAVKSGHRIAQLSQMESSILNRLANRIPTGNHPKLQRERPASAREHLETCMKAVNSLSIDQLERTLADAAADLPRRHLFEHVVTPLMEKIGQLWSDGSMKILNEHMASFVVQSFLWDLLRGANANGDRPSIVVATPAGQSCILGALVVAVIATDLGWHAHFFGGNLPAEDIVASVRTVSARAVVLSITYRAEPSFMFKEIRRLQKGLDPRVTLLVGGRAAATVEDAISSAGGVRVSDLSHFVATLENLDMP